MGQDANDTLLRDLIILDEEINYVVLRGHKDESISSRCGRCIKRAAPAQALPFGFLFLILAGVVNAMPWFGPNHCVNNIDERYLTETD